ncbi:ATP-grasp ribosomal peptide maturase [Kribbella sp. NPDC058693]|uniref:ATP-grasp ribosomal peptide maturase n=1 Tax=Kribbella sp. NPDC058693 TaxID=3346602 RepID=UPI0036555127
MTMSDPVLVLTCIDDPTSDAVIEELNSREVPVVRCDPADVLTGRLNVAAQYGSGPSTLRTTSRDLDLHTIRSVYYRRPSPYRAPAGLTDHDGRFAADQARHGMGGVLAGIRARWVNHIWRSLEADFKPAQLAVAHELGFVVPPTLVTNVPGEARTFADAHDQVLYKPLHASELHGEDGSLSVIWVDEVSPHDLDDSIGTTLHMFQQRVDKVADVRTTVIGANVFSVRIDSPHLDWRRDYGAVTYSVIDTPDDVAKACRRYLERFGLLFGAFDFGLGADGQWSWYECNSGGQWHWLELETGLPMTAALADLLEHVDD